MALIQKRFYLLFIEEHQVAKRRNLKKEKASRNQAYARQFRKKSSHFSSRKKWFSKSDKQQDDTGAEEDIKHDDN
jgi:ribosomal protein L44E